MSLPASDSRLGLVVLSEPEREAPESSMPGLLGTAAEPV